MSVSDSVAKELMRVMSKMVSLVWAYLELREIVYERMSRGFRKLGQFDTDISATETAVDNTRCCARLSI